MEKWFEKQPRLIQILLLIIPGVNWLVEVLVRWSHYFRTRNIFKLIIAILVIPGVGIVLGYVDLIWCLLFNRLVFCD